MVRFMYGCYHRFQQPTKLGIHYRGVQWEGVQWMGVVLYSSTAYDIM